MTARLSVSNIAWSEKDRIAIYALLRDMNVDGVEIAPSKIASWDEIDLRTLCFERSLIESYGLRVSSHQALYFGRPQLQLLSDESSFRALLEHTVRVAQLAESLNGGGPGVFGAPRNRLRANLSEQDAFALGSERFRRLAEAVAPYDFVLALEPAPAQYGGDFLLTAKECAAMVRQVAHPSLRLHIDAGCLEIAGEDGAAMIADHADIICHVHLSRPQLAPVDPQTTDNFALLLDTLASIGYGGWAAIEMRETADPARAVQEAISAVRSSEPRLRSDP